MSDEIRTRPATQEYRDGWERTFGNGREVGGVLAGTGATVADVERAFPPLSAYAKPTRAADE